MIRVRATDGGSPPLDADVDVELDVVDRNNKPPVWEQRAYGPIYVKENAAAGTTVTSVRARFVDAPQGLSLPLTWSGWGMPWAFRVLELTPFDIESLTPTGQTI